MYLRQLASVGAMQVWGGAQSSGHHPHPPPAVGGTSQGQRWLCAYDLRQEFDTSEEAERFRKRTRVHIPKWPDSGQYLYLYHEELRYLADDRYPEADIKGLAQGLQRQTRICAENERGKVLQVLPSDAEQERKRDIKAKAKAEAKAKADAKAKALQRLSRS